GEYYVSATYRSGGGLLLDLVGGANAGGPTGSNNNAGYASTYYPSTPNPAEAQRGALGAGQELASGDLQLQPVRLSKIAGTALGSDGKPMSGAMVMLMPSMKDAMMFMPGGTSRTDKDGNFTLNGVAPGEYSLQVQSTGGLFQTTAGGGAMVFNFATAASDGSQAPANAPAQREFGGASVTVAGDDITGL